MNAIVGLVLLTVFIFVVMIAAFKFSKNKKGNFNNSLYEVRSFVF